MSYFSHVCHQHLDMAAAVTGISSEATRRGQPGGQATTSACRIVLGLADGLVGVLLRGDALHVAAQLVREVVVEGLQDLRALHELGAEDLGEPV